MDVNHQHSESGRASKAFAGCVLLILLAGALSFSPSLGIGGDNAEYLVLGQSLAQGQGYRLASQPGAPEETKRWPGYPLFLAGVIALAGANLSVLKTTSLVCIAGATALSLVYVRRQHTVAWWIPAAAVALFILNENVLHHASSLYAEGPFMLLSIGALVALDKAADNATDRRIAWAVGAGLLCAAAIYVRPHGLALIPAAFVFLALRRQWRVAFAVPALIVVALLPWAWRQVQETKSGQATYVAHTLDSREEDTAGVSEVQKYAHRIVRNAGSHFLSLGQMIVARPRHIGFLPPEPAAPEPTPVATAEREPAAAAPTAAAATGGSKIDLGRASRYLLAAIVLVGAAVTWRGTGSAAHWYIIFTMALLLITPWPRGRYLLPMLPFFAWFLVAAIVWGGGRAGRLIGKGRGRALGVAGVAGALSLAMLLTTMTVSQQAVVNWRARGLPWYAPERYAHEGSDVANYVRAAIWVRDNTPSNAVVVARKPHIFYCISGRPGRVVWAESAEGAWSGFQNMLQHGPVYVVRDAFGDRYDPRQQARAWWQPALEAHPAAQTVFETGLPVVTVWSVTSVDSQVQRK